MKSTKKQPKLRSRRGEPRVQDSLKVTYSGIDKLLYLFSFVIIISLSIIAIPFFDLSTRFENFLSGKATNYVTSTQDIVSSTKAFFDCTKKSALNGVCVEDEDEQYTSLVGVMIENHVDSRPQSGLAKASVVYEAPVEANYTRFLALFPAEANVQKVGPVRSSRPYFLDWLVEYDEPLYMHVGGSPDALEKIPFLHITSVNEMTKGWYFWRSKDRYAPHNTYTSTNLWGKAYEDLGKDLSFTNVTSWKFANDVPPCEESCAHTLDITFLAPNYTANWKYNEDTKKYERFHGKVRHIDQDGAIVAADTIIVQHVTSKVLDEVGRLDIDTIGTGNVEVYQRGHKISGTWKKNSERSRTNWFDESGDHIPLQSGTIWIEVVNERAKVKDVITNSNKEKEE